MKFLELELKDGFFQRTFEFSEIANLIYSKKNTAGKTTFLRAILYSLGYQIPSTKGIRFDNMEFCLTIENLEKKYIINRRDSYLSINDGDKQIDYSLPTDFYKVMSLLTGCDNKEILNNLLGAFYMDQEKGWTLLNRGKVIGDISFNVEELVRGLDGKNCNEEINKLEAVERSLKKYKYMLSVSEYQEKLYELGDDIEYNAPNEKIDINIETLQAEREPISKEMRQISEIERKNKILVDYISEFKFVVKSDSGEEVPVTKNTLVNFNDNSRFLSARKNVLANEIKKIDEKIAALEKKKNKGNYLFNVESAIEAFDSNIKKISVDPIATKRIIDDFNKERRQLKKLINDKTKSNNQVVQELHDCISVYAKELGVNEEYISQKRDYIFTSDLKSLSGAVLHKIVFSFKLAYIKLIKEKAGIMLPIVLDSPSGREVEHSTVELMIKILQRDFSEHQLIIASIYDYDLNQKKTIEFKDRILNMSDAIIIKE